jgi:hypothetical protein
VDACTWEALLSTDEGLRSEALTHAQKPITQADESGALKAAASPAVPRDSGSSPIKTGASDSDEDCEGWMGDEEAARALSSAPGGSRWPVLTEMEGGKEVQLMQVRACSFLCEAN